MRDQDCRATVPVTDSRGRPGIPGRGLGSSRGKKVGTRCLCSACSSNLNHSRVFHVLSATPSEALSFCFFCFHTQGSPGAGRLKQGVTQSPP